MIAPVPPDTVSSSGEFSLTGVSFLSHLTEVSGEETGEVEGAHRG